MTFNKEKCFNMTISDVENNVWSIVGYENSFVDITNTSNNFNISFTRDDILKMVDKKGISFICFDDYDFTTFSWKYLINRNPSMLLRLSSYYKANNV